MQYKKIVIITNGSESKACWEKYISILVKTKIQHITDIKELGHIKGIKTSEIIRSLKIMVDGDANVLQSYFIIYDITDDTNYDWLYYLFNPEIYYIITDGIPNIHIYDRHRINGKSDNSKELKVELHKYLPKLLKKYKNNVKILGKRLTTAQIGIFPIIFKLASNNSELKIPIITEAYSDISDEDKRKLQIHIKDGNGIVIINNINDVNSKNININVNYVNILRCSTKPIVDSKYTINDKKITKQIDIIVRNFINNYIAIFMNTWRLNSNYMTGILKKDNKYILSSLLYDKNTLPLGDNKEYYKGYHDKVNEKVKIQFRADYARSINELHLFIYDGHKYIKFIPNDVEITRDPLHIYQSYYNALIKFIEYNCDRETTYKFNNMLEYNKNTIFLALTQWLDAIITTMIIEYNNGSKPPYMTKYMNIHSKCSIKRSKEIYILNLSQYTITKLMYIFLYDPSDDNKLSTYDETKNCDAFSENKNSLKYDPYVIIVYLHRPSESKDTQNVRNTSGTNPLSSSSHKSKSITNPLSSSSYKSKSITNPLSSSSRKSKSITNPLSSSSYKSKSRSVGKSSSNDPGKDWGLEKDKDKDELKIKYMGKEMLYRSIDDSVNNEEKKFRIDVKIPDTYVRYSIFKIGKKTAIDFINSVAPPGLGKESNNTFDKYKKQTIDIIDAIYDNRYALVHTQVGKGYSISDGKLSRANPRQSRKNSQITRNRKTRKTNKKK